MYFRNAQPIFCLQLPKVDDDGVDDDDDDDDGTYNMRRPTRVKMSRWVRGSH